MDVKFTAQELAQHSAVKFFAYDHLSDDLKAIAAPFRQMARTLFDVTPYNSERNEAVRLLLAAKEEAVRSFVSGPESFGADETEQAHYAAKRFRTEGMSGHVLAAAEPFAVLAQEMLALLPLNGDRREMLRYLADARASAVRACIGATE